MTDIKQAYGDNTRIKLFGFFLAAVGLHCFMQAFSSSEEGALLFVVRARAFDFISVAAPVAACRLL